MIRYPKLLAAFAFVLLVLCLGAPPLRAADRDRLEAFLTVTGFDVALESIRLSAETAPLMLGLEADDYGSEWVRLTEDVFDTATMKDLALDILEQTLSDPLLTHAADFYASDLGQRLVEVENTSHMQEDDAAKEAEGTRLVAQMVETGSPRLEYFKRMNTAIDASGNGARAVLEVQYRFLIAASAAGLVDMQLDPEDLRLLLARQEPGLRLALQVSALSGAAYTYRDISNQDLLAYADALEAPKMQQVYELMNAVQFEIMADRFEVLAERMTGLQPGAGYLMRVVLMVLVVCLGAFGAGGIGEARAEDAPYPRTRALLDLMRLDDLLGALRVEGLSYAQDYGMELLQKDPGPRFTAVADRIYDIESMRALMEESFAEALDPATLDAALDFFSSDFGARVIALETTARVAISDPSIEALARDAYIDVLGSDDPHLAAVRRFVDVNNLVERNTSGSLSATFQFFSGLSDAGFLDLTEREIIQEVWSKYDAIETDNEEWLFGLLLMAYRPLADGELDRYIAFFETPEGRQLNTALFDGFDEVLHVTSYALGRSIGDLAREVEL